MFELLTLAIYAVEAVIGVTIIVVVALKTLEVVKEILE